MVDVNTKFGGMLTVHGAAKKTNCDALQVPWQLTHMLLGDGNGADPVPDPNQTALVNQVHRAALNALYVSPSDANVLIAELVLPPDVGGWWIREMALEDADGVFSAVGNCAPSYKPVLAQGSGRNQVIRMHIITNGTDNIQLKIDPSIVLATRQYVDTEVLEAGNALQAHKESTSAHDWNSISGKPQEFQPTNHAHTPEEVGLSLVGNHPMATQAEAEAAESLARYMNPVRTRQAFQKYGLGTHGVNNKVTDLNNIVESGWYGSVTTTLNIPIASDGVVLHSSWTASSGGRASQIYFASNILRSFIRHKGSGGSWGEWGEMAHTGNMQASLLENGYQKLPSGLILQWGVFAGGLDEPVSITFPIAFPNAAFNVSLSTQQVTYAEMQPDQRIDISSLSPTSFGVTRPGTPTNIHGFYWSAIGH